jgi:hypothetical protein
MALLREHPKLLNGWPPKPVEVYSGYGFLDPDPGEILLLSVVPEDEDTTVILHGRHVRGACRYYLQTADEEFATLLRIWLNRHLGKSLLELGNLDVEEKIGPLVQP